MFFKYEIYLSMTGFQNKKKSTLPNRHIQARLKYTEKNK